MRYLILLFGVFACATSVIFIRTSSTDPLLLSAYRLLLGVVFLLPLTWRARRRHPTYRMSREFRQVLWPGALLALHFITWIDGARQTAAANATLLVNMTPVAMPFFLWFVARERVTRGEMLGTLVALMGVVLLVGADLRYAGQNVLGDVICFVSMLLYTAYLAFARRNRAIPSIYLYVVPLYTVAGVLCLAAGLVRWFLVPEVGLIGDKGGAELIAIVGLALVPTVLGHSTINWAFKHIRGQAVSTINLSQAIFAAAMAAFILHEIPGPALYLAGGLILCGAVVVVRSGRTLV